MTEVSRRFLLAAGGDLLALAAFKTRLATPPISRAVRVTDYRLAEDEDDSAAFRRAIALGRPVHVPAGGGSASNGAYVIDEVEPVAGTVLFGDGIGRSVIRPKRTEQPAQRAALHCDSGSPSSQILGIRISGLTFEGWAAEQGFSEHQHLLHLNGVDGLVVEDVEFRAFQGDGLYLGSSRRAGTERHNRRIAITRCIFDGVNHQNRNAISVIDGEQILIEDCSFANCTRPNMPGAIDFEPDESPFARIRGITIRNCRFENVGGNVAVISFHIPKLVRALPSQVEIVGNHFANYKGTGAEIHLNTSRLLTDSDPDMGVAISGNVGSGGQTIYAFYAVKGVSTSGNRWLDYDQGSAIGYTDPSQLARRVSIRDTFVRCGRVSAVGMYVFNVSRLQLNGSRFIDCGNGGPNAYAVSFAEGRSEFVTLRDVRVTSPGGRTRFAVIRETLHQFTPATNVQADNDFGGLSAIDILK